MDLEMTHERSLRGPCAKGKAVLKFQREITYDKAGETLSYKSYLQPKGE